MASSVAENPLILLAAAADAVVFGLLVTARNAARVALGCMHPPASLLQGWDAQRGPVRARTGAALRAYSLRGHRSSVRLKLAFSSAYHLPTG
jgi:hypothetical protein